MNRSFPPYLFALFFVFSFFRVFVIQADASPVEKARKHWAFQPITRPPVPKVRWQEWVRNPIDAFVLARLEAAGLTPAVEADRAILLRRASFDLLGLPPAPQEIEVFLKDERPEAWELLIERLLASPAYGERWGRHWLDVVRYADSAGYEIDDFAGTLNRKPYGPAVYPPIDPSILKTKLNVKWDVPADRKEWSRRGVYLVVRRSLVLPIFRTFNAAIPVESIGGREDTVEATQALALLNGPIAVEQSRLLAGRLLRECGDDLPRLVERAWLLVFGRRITADERKKALEFLAASRRIGGPTPLGGPEKVDPVTAAAVVELSMVLLNANEFLYVD